MGKLQDVALQRVRPKAKMDAPLVRLLRQDEGGSRVAAARKEEVTRLIRERGLEGVVLAAGRQRSPVSDPGARPHEIPFELFRRDAAAFDILRASERKRHVLERERRLQTGWNEPAVVTGIVGEHRDVGPQALRPVLPVTPEEESSGGNQDALLQPARDPLRTEHDRRYRSPVAGRGRDCFPEDRFGPGLPGAWGSRVLRRE